MKLSHKVIACFLFPLAAAVAHADVYWVYEPRANGGKVLQFIVRVCGSGAC